ncbi:Uncharacterised protein [uncultured archaeon]|nr:Uncharacterised protein [uncultured archaeon]
MVNCERCGISEENTPDGLYAAVYDGKLVPMCRKCADFEDLVVVKKIHSYVEPAKERQQSVYERMVHISGVKRDPSQFDKKKPSEAIPAGSKEPTLRDIVEKNLKKSGSPVLIQKVVKTPKLVNNHHWIVMRSRRGKKISQEQLAELINEPVAVIAQVERGQMPENPYVFKKLEGALKIRILAEPLKEGDYFSPMIDESELNLKGVKKDKTVMFDSDVFGGMKVEDLKDLDAERGIETGQDKVSYWNKFKKKTKKKEEPKEKEAEEYLEEMIEPEEEKEESPEEVSESEVKKEKTSFLKKLFSKKKKEEPEEVVEEVVVEEPPVPPKPETKKSYRERQQHTSGMSKRDLSSKEINELIFGKKEEKGKK